jgi:SAM-dependent methyltransferase
MEKMKESTEKQLSEINDTFYTRFGREFAETRRRIQPGVGRVLDEVIHSGDWLDLGCGSGTLGCVWAEKGFTGLYEGLDLSPVLIAEAQKVTAAVKHTPELRLVYGQADLSQPGWTRICSQPVYDGVLMFAAMHHIPAYERRLGLMKEIAGLLKPGGKFIHSEWQFQRSTKLMTHVVPWEQAGISADELEEGDTLLDWRHTSPERPAETGLRYVHLFSSGELAQLAGEGGFTITAEFDSDGASGNLSLYQVWQRN